ncbi:MAG: SEL1-like repeat protein [Clostridia bacterium]|nr:SEL1-like repeat protein [Clostridia bacterium]
MRKYILKQKIARAKAGDADEQYELGKAYINGEDVRCNEGKGEKYLLSAAAQSHAAAQFELGKFYLKRDKEKAEHWLAKAATNGSDEAAYLMGMRYFDGKHAPRSLEKAAQWYAVSAKRGHAPSMLMLGKTYSEGKDKKRKAEAKKLFEELEKSGDAEAQYHLAHCCLGKDFVRAVELLEKSAKGGFYKAFDELAYYYINENTDEGFKKAVNAFTVAAEHGVVYSMFQLGNIYYDGRLNVRCDPDKAFYWFSKCGDFALTQVGKCYLYGVGVKRNVKKAVKILSEEAKFGAPAKYELAHCYYNGWGVQKDINRAKELYEQALKRGVEEAASDLKEKFK